MQPGVGRKPYRSRLRVDGEFYLDLQICADYHIPHSEFLSWEPDDRAKAVAFYLEKNARCTMCGTTEWEWEENRFAYEATTVTCEGCRQRAIMSESVGNQPGVSVILTPTNTVEHAKRHLRAERRWAEEMARKAEDDRSRLL